MTDDPLVLQKPSTTTRSISTDDDRVSTKNNDDDGSYSHNNELSSDTNGGGIILLPSSSQDLKRTTATRTTRKSSSFGYRKNNTKSSSSSSIISSWICCCCCTTSTWKDKIKTIVFIAGITNILSTFHALIRHNTTSSLSFYNTLLGNSTSASFLSSTLPYLEQQQQQLRDYDHLLINDILQSNTTATTRGLDETLSTTTINDSQQYILPTGLVNNFSLQAVRYRYTYDKNASLPLGILSNQNDNFFRQLQYEIDTIDNRIRCIRYNGYYNISLPPRKLFYGALIANEPWELIEMIATESYGLYSGIVFVEGNRTQNLTPRKPQRSATDNRTDPTQLYHVTTLRQLFGTTNIQIRLHVHEGLNRYRLGGLAREHAQRDEIIQGWKELGMTVDDVGIIADMDETHTRDFLNAIRVCDGIKALNYNQHHCFYGFTKIIGMSRVYESSPECITQGRTWAHPDAVVGHCIQGIAPLDSIHPKAPRKRNSFLRADGWGNKCGDWDKANALKNNSHPLMSAADFRRLCGGSFIHMKKTKLLIDNNDKVIQHKEDDEKKIFDGHTGYHFHNFFDTFNHTRFKYKTYGHPDKNANTNPINAMSNDLLMMYNCIQNITDNWDADEQKWKRIIGGYNATLPYYPIYFQDDDYRSRRHQHVQEQVAIDDQIIANLKLQKNTTKKTQPTTARRILSNTTLEEYFTKCNGTYPCPLR